MTQLTVSLLGLRAYTCSRERRQAPKCWRSYIVGAIVEIAVPLLDSAALQQGVRISIRQVGAVALWSAVIWVVVFWRLGYLSLLDPDEAHYAELTREMLRARQWLVPTLEGVPFIDKPVLYHWLQMGAEWLFGETEFALRLPSALAAVALIGIVAWIGRALSGRPAGAVAALLFTTTPLTFALASIGIFDMVYATFLFGAVGALIVAGSNKRRKVELIGWTLLALAVMTKGPVAGLLIVAFGSALALRPATRSIVTNLLWMQGLAFVALVACPWFVFMALRFGDRFFRDYMLAGNLLYFTNPAAFSSRQSDLFFYGRTFLGGFFPWSVIGIGVVVDARLSGRRLTVAEQALYTWIVVILAFFTAAGFKLDTYIFPVAPALCLAVALAWHTPDGHTAPTVGPATRAAIFAVAIALVAGGGILAATIFTIQLGLSPLAALLPITLVAGGLSTIWLLWRWAARPPHLALAGTLIAVYALVVVEGFPVLER